MSSNTPPIRYPACYSPLTLIPRFSASGLVLAAWLLLGGPYAGATITLEVGKSNGAPPFPHTNGRQIARNSDGIWFLAYDSVTEGRSTIFLAASRDGTPEFAGDFHPAVAIAGGSDAAVLAGAVRDASVASLVIDEDDVLHLVWQSSDPEGIWYSRCSVKGKEPAAAFRNAVLWTGAGGGQGAERIDDGVSPQLGDVVIDEKGQLRILYSQTVEVPPDHVFHLLAKGHPYSRRLRRKPAGQIWAASPKADGWTRRPLTLPGDYGPPVADLDPQGTLHLTSARAGSWFIFYLQLPEFAGGFDQGRDFTAVAPHVPWSGTGYVSHSVAGWGRTALVVWEKVEHQLQYAYYDGRSWTVQPLHHSQEALHHPILARDEHGVAWVFWTNTTRSHSFYSRWLGSRFSAPYECRMVGGDPVSHEEATRAPSLSHFHTVERNSREGSGTLGMALSVQAPTGSVYFDPLLVPELNPEPGRKVLFLDMLEVSALDGLDESFHPMRKHPANPVLRPGPAGSWDDKRAIAYGEVFHEEGRFRMWYAGIDRQASGYMVGYAESEDGVDWVKPVLNQVEYKGSTENNILDLAYNPYGYWTMMVKDEREPDPEKHYKVLVAHTGGNRLHTSPDGLRWTEGIVVNPDRLPSGERNPGRFGDRRGLFDDSLEKDPERRWKVFGRTCTGPEQLIPRRTRRTCRYWSPDLIRWTPDPRNPVMVPRAGTEVEQHAMSVWIDAGMYLGMFDVWDAMQLSPQQLVVSRDGRNFVHVFDGSFAIELGDPGTWDEGWISPINVPIAVGDELWNYYSGGPVTIGPFHDWNTLPMYTGLATIRRDGFVSLDVQKGRSAGWFKTLPLKPGAEVLSLEVNADGLARGAGRISVDLLRGGEVLATSNAVTEDGVATPVRWPVGGSRLRMPESGQLRLRFRLEGEARLYSFTFR